MKRNTTPAESGVTKTAPHPRVAAPTWQPRQASGPRQSRAKSHASGQEDVLQIDTPGRLLLALPDGGPIRSGATGKPDVGRGGRRTRNVEAPGLPWWLRLRCRIAVESIRLRVDVTSRDVGIQRERAPAIGQGSCFLLACLGFAGFHAVHCLLGRCLGLKLSHHFHAWCQ